MDSNSNAMNVNAVEAGAVQGANIANSQVNTIYINTPGTKRFSDYYQRIGIIGRGTFGDAWKVKAKHVFGSEDIEFAMKEIRCSDKDANAGRQEIEKRNRHSMMGCVPQPPSRNRRASFPSR